MVEALFRRLGRDIDIVDDDAGYNLKFVGAERTLTS